jgi:alpha-N-arabinofuranosidase
MRRDVIELLKEMRAPLLRWPGGNFAGDYRWQDGLLPVDKRAPLMSYMPVETLPHSGGHDDHDVGIDEFIALCREVGAEAFLSVNLGQEGPEEAAAWVEYCNGGSDTHWGAKRSARGFPEPYGVRYWAVGNEMGYGHMEGPNDPRGYAAKARETAKAMLDKDPDLRLILSGLYHDDNEWYTECLEAMADIVHHISCHQYTPPISSYLGEEGIAECRRLAAAADQTAGLLTRIRGYIDAHAPGRDIGISFDEWNVWYGWYREPGVNEGIHTAAMLNMLVREAVKLGLTLGCFFEPVNEGAIWVEPEQSWLTPSGQVFALFAAHYERTSLELDGRNGDLDAAASLDETEGRLAVTLVNRDPVEAREVEIHVPHGNVSGTLLSAESFLPASRFDASELEIASREGQLLTAVLPKHSVARIEICL